MTDKPMTVGELIEKLKCFDPNMSVAIEMLGMDGSIEGIYNSKDGYIMITNHDNIIRKWNQ